MKFNKRILLITSGLLMLAAVISYVIFRFMAQAKVDDAYHILREAGYPVDADTLLPTVADSDNAALLYEAAHIMLQSAGWEDLAVNIEGTDEEDLDKEQLSLIASFLNTAATQNIINTLHEADQKTACRFIDDVSAGPFILMPHCSWHLHPFLSSAFDLHIHQNQFSKAQECLRLNIGLSNRFLNEPFLLSHLVGCAWLNKNLTQLKELAEHDIARAIALLPSFKPEEMPESFINSMHSERILMGEWAFTQSYDHDLNSLLGTEMFGAGLYRITPFWDLDHAAYLNIFYQLTKISEEPYSLKELDYTPSSYHIMSSLLLPALSGIRTQNLTTIANIKITTAGIKVLNYKKKNNTYPKGLESINITAIDPFNNKPLEYKTTADGFIISSAGKNLDYGPDAPHWEYAVNN